MDDELDSDELDALVETAHTGRVSADSLFGQGTELTAAQPHGSNILKKARDSAGGDDEDLVAEIAARYMEWRRAALDLTCDDLETPEAFAAGQALLFQQYRDFLDEDRMDRFDSRGNLQSSVLEEFCYYLLRPLFEDREQRLSLGHREVFQGLYFRWNDFDAFSQLPTPMYPVGNLDFIIGKVVDVTFASGDQRYETKIHVPVVAIECKTYLDRPRWIESDVLATSVKNGAPNCLYVVLSEFLKLDTAKVNIHGSAIDRVYILRRSRNVDRSVRRRNGAGLPPVYGDSVRDLFVAVRDHLDVPSSANGSWAETGVLK